MSDLPFQLRVHYPHSAEHGQAASRQHVLAAVREMDGVKEYDTSDPIGWINYGRLGRTTLGRYLVIPLDTEDE